MAHLCKAWAIEPLPLTPDVVEKVSASFKNGGYRRARQYFSQARRQHVLHTRASVPADVELYIRDMIRGLERGVGGPALKDSFRLELLSLPDPDDDLTLAMRQRAAVIVLGCWFLLREIEVAALKVKYFVVDKKTQTVRLTLQSSKNDMQGNLVMRCHSCYCNVLQTSLCPFHVAQAFYHLLPKDPEAPAFSTFQGDVLSKAETIQLIRSLLVDNNIEVTRAGMRGEVQRFGGHALRVSGAQFLSRCGVPLPTIMLIGRWGSRSVERYAQEAALDNFTVAEPRRPVPHQPCGQPDTDATQEMQVPDPQNPAAALRVEETLAGVNQQLKDLALKVENLQERPELILARRAHARDPNEVTLLPLMWRARCGWPYGRASFRRASWDTKVPKCKNCFPPDSSCRERESMPDSEGDKARSDTEESSSGSDSQQSGVPATD